MADEIKLIQASIAGDTIAFEQIVQKYQSLICSITFSGTGRIDLSEDIAQETFLRAWKNLKQLKDLSGFRPWLCAIARNLLHNYYRKNKPSLLDSEVLDQVADQTPNPPETLIEQEESAMLEQAIMQIPVEYREPLVMFYRQNQSARQVAEDLGINESTVRTRLHRARQMLREQIAERLEQTLRKSAPGKQFTKAVMLAVGATAVGLSAGSAAASTVADSAAGTSAASTVSAIITTTTAKIVAAVAVAAVIIGVAIAYVQRENPESRIRTSNTALPLNTQQDNVSDQQQVRPRQSQEAVKTATVPDNQDAQIIDPLIETTSEISVQVSEENHPEPETVETNVYAFSPDGVLSGLITDAETGAPVTDAKLELSMGRVYITKTDENGFYSFEKINETGNYHLGISSNEYLGMTDYHKQPIVHLQKDSQEVRHFQLEKACMLDVWVVDEQGHPLKDAYLYATSLADDQSAEFGYTSYSKKTDEEGYKLLGGFPPSQSPYLITVMHNNVQTVSEKDGIRYTKAFPNYAYAGQQVILTDPNVISSVEIVLKKGTKVKGYAEYLDGVPAGGLGICAYPDWWHSNTCPTAWPIDPNGYFTIDQIIPGTYNMQINIPTGQGSSIGKPLFSKYLPLPEGACLKVTVPEKSPQSLVSISGTITFSGDKVPSYLSISAISRQHGHQSKNVEVNSDRNEPTSFCIDRLEPGTYRLEFESSEVEPLTINDVQAPADDIAVQLQVTGKPILSGTVMDAETGKSVENIKVRVKKLKNHRGPSYIQSNQWIHFVEKNGAFQVEAVGPGLYQVQVASDGYAAQWSQQIDTDNNQPIQIMINKGGTIIGTVKDTQGKPISNASVIPFSIAGGVNNNTLNMFISSDGAVQTDKQGKFLLSHLAEGTETLKITHIDYADYIAKEIEVLVNQTTEIEPIILDKGASIQGYVLDGSGQPEAGVTLYVQDDSGYSGGNDEKAGRLAVATTDPNGFYRIDNLPEQMCYLRRQDAAQAEGVIRRTVLPRNGETCRIDFGGSNTVTGQVILQGQPAVNGKIQIAPVGNPHFGAFTAFAITDDQGRFTFHPGISGNYAVYHQVGKNRDWNQLAKISLSANEDLDLGVIPTQPVTLNVYLDQNPEAFQWEISSLMVLPAESKFGSAVGTLKAPEEPGAPYTMTSLQAGQYLITMYRRDGLIYRVPVEITGDKPQQDLTIKLPVSNCSLNILAAKDVEYLSLLSEDENVQMGLRLNEEKVFSVENLPLGRYSISHGMSIDNSMAVTAFDLLEGEIKTIDVTGFSIDNTVAGALQIEIVDENGSPVNDCSIWLTNNERKLNPTMQYGFKIIFIAPAGDYTIHAERPGYKQITQSISLKPINPSDPGAKHQQMSLRLKLEE